MIDPLQFGVSFSTKQCRNFGINPQEVLVWLLTVAGFRRFRIMTYWDEHELSSGQYDFTELDKQIYTIEKYGGIISLCLGVRQPRWPESHWPKWAMELETSQRYSALEKYIQIIVERYKNNRTIIDYQLENEALNRKFGENGDFSRKRLRSEFKMVKQLDSRRPIIMSTSNSWGLPVLKPRPDIIGFSIYRVIYRDKNYHFSGLPMWTYKFRAFLARIILRRQSFIHELQAEPWGPAGIWEMDIKEQDKSMNPEQLHLNVELAKKAGLYPIDLWGGEWWYWRLKKHRDPSIWENVHSALTATEDK